jgi:hypothetical protein
MSESTAVSFLTKFIFTYEQLRSILPSPDLVPVLATNTSYTRCAITIGNLLMGRSIGRPGRVLPAGNYGIFSESLR